MEFNLFFEAEPDQHLAPTIDDLKTCLLRSTGAELTLEEDPPKDTGSGIWIGKTAAADRFSERISELDHDGYLLWGNGSQVIITGKTSYGTANGVYSFIHRFLGVRWFAPGPLFEFIPSHQTFKLPKIVDLKNPSFSLRMYSGADRDWCRRNLIDVQCPNLPLASFSHNLTNIYPSSKYSETHPELYAMVNGKRITQQTSHRGQPCFSNPDAVKIAVNAIHQYFDENPGATMFSVSVNDNVDFCECEKCSRYQVKSFRGRPIYSNAYFEWVNEVAKQIVESHPDKLLGALAYWGVVLPPDEIPKLPPNVVVVLTQDTSQHHDENYEKEDRRILSQWIEKCEKLVKYDYYGLGWLTPRYFPELASKDLEYIRKSGAIGFYCEAYPFWPIFGPQLYMAANKSWNITRDHRELLREYYSFFSPVSNEISSFYEILERSWLADRPGSWFEGLGDITDELKVMTLEDANKARDNLSRALEDSTGNCRRRVKYLRDGFEFSYQLIKGHHTSSELRFLPVSELSDLRGALPLLLQVQDSIIAAEKIHREKIKPDDLYPEVYFKDRRFQKKFRAWKGMLNSTCMTWLERAFEFLDGDTGAWEELLGKLPNSLAQQADIIPHLCEYSEQIEDPGFEKMERSPAAGTGSEIGKWGLFGENCICSIDENFSKTGARSLSLEGNGRNHLSIYMPVKPGGRYVVSAWMYAEQMVRRRMPKLEITLLTGPDDMPGSTYSTDLLYGSGEWQRLFSLIDVEESMKTVGVHVVINNEFDRIWIDDVSVREIPKVDES